MEGVLLGTNINADSEPMLIDFNKLDDTTATSVAGKNSKLRGTLDTIGEEFEMKSLWTAITEGNPPEPRNRIQKYYVTLKSGYTHVAFYIREDISKTMNGIRWYGPFRDDSEVIAWMILPDAYNPPEGFIDTEMPEEGEELTREELYLT